MEDKELYELAYNKVQEFYYKIPIKLMYQSPVKLKFYMPYYFIQLLHKYYHSVVSYQFPELTPDNKLKMFGIEIIQGYENKIILAHEDAAIHADCKVEVLL